jgi:hypothetical protein
MKDLSKAVKVKILCHSCGGNQTVLDTHYSKRRPVEIVCPECDGLGYVEFMGFPKEADSADTNELNGSEEQKFLKLTGATKKPEA